MSTLAISLLGAGRMGREIMACINEDPGLTLAGVWVRPGSSLLGVSMAEYAGPGAAAVTASSDLPAVLAAADVAIDFSLPAATPAILDAVCKSSTPLVCGVSGLNADLQAALQRAAGAVPVFYERNMSIGIALMRRLVADAARLLGPDFAASIHDLHHAAKLDAPSGTALLLGEALAAARNQVFADVMRYNADGTPAARSDGDIVFEVRREGQHPGSHTVRFQSAAETLSIRHDVSNRRVFASGAVRAARWLRGRPAGFYTMQDLLADSLPA
jgi:4-hydroxy-tetrahydrodipicolinate reductase